ncbi:MAG: dephospho-CoA kinase [Clostridia bacterium]
MKLVGLTGGIASGKSTVSRLLRESGISVVDADQIVHRLEETGNRGWRALFRLCGYPVLRADGSLDRVRMGRWLFSDSDLRARVNATLHPLVRQEMWREVRELENAGRPCVVVDVPLLVENGLHRLVDEVLVVWATREQQLQRLMARNGLGREEAERRLRSQWDLTDKLGYASRVLDNTGSVDDLVHQVKEAVRELLR